MKTMRILQAGVLCAAMVCAQVRGALLTTGQNSSSPYYSDFTAQGLNINYNASTGVFNATRTTANTQNSFIDNVDSEGTHGAYNNGGAGTGFTGTFSLTAHVHFVAADNQYEVYGTGNTFTIEGNLLGKGNTDVLLTGTLATGVNSLGYDVPGGTQFDFLFTPASGEASILADYFGTANGRGAVILNAGSYLTAYTGMNANFQNKSQGTADTFVPEPSAYGLAGAVVAVGCLSLGRKKKITLAV